MESLIADSCNICGATCWPRGPFCIHLRYLRGSSTFAHQCTGRISPALSGSFQAFPGNNQTALIALTPSPHRGSSIGTCYYSPGSLTSPTCSFCRSSPPATCAQLSWSSSPIHCCARRCWRGCNYSSARRGTIFPAWLSCSCECTC